ncbi:MAG: type II secretion system F family protein [Candidatus Nanopelagicales bacterium]
MTGSPGYPARRGRRERKRKSSDVERSDEISLQASVVADVLAATLAAGAPIEAALRGAAEASDQPTRGHLERVVSALEWGADPHQAWAALLDDPGFAPVARVVVRSHTTGASMSDALESAAMALRKTHVTAVEARARAAGVRSVAPLALCFLPAYLLVGVVPVIAGFAGDMFR